MTCDKQQRGDVMAVIGTNPVFGRIADALGLRMCRGFTIKANMGDAVTIQAQQYATGKQFDGVADALETKDYVLVPREEYDRLVQTKRIARVLRGELTANLRDAVAWACGLIEATAEPSAAIAHCHRQSLQSLLTAIDAAVRPAGDDTKEVT